MSGVARVFHHPLLNYVGNVSAGDVPAAWAVAPAADDDAAAAVPSASAAEAAADTTAEAAEADTNILAAAEAAEAAVVDTMGMAPEFA